MVKASIDLAISPLNTKKAALKYDGLRQPNLVVFSTLLLATF